MDLVAQLIAAAQADGIAAFEQVAVHEDGYGKRRFVSALRCAGTSTVDI